MKKLQTILTVVVLLYAGAGSLFAQGEKESVSQFRVTSDFQTPMVTPPAGENASTDGENEEVTMVSPDSFGVHYLAPQAFWRMIDLHRSVNNEIEYTRGFRIQIYAGSSLDVANDAKADFMISYDEEDCPVYQLWNPPHFRVRVGDFLTRSEAMAEVAAIRQIFPDAFIVADDVKVPRFKERKPLDEEDEEENLESNRKVGPDPGQ